MSKKSYRPGPLAVPQYPRLVEVNRRSALHWGLIAVGGAWLGNASCDRASLVGAAEAKGEQKGTDSSKEMGMRGKMAIALLPDAGAPDARAPKANKPTSSAAEIPPLPPPGAPPQPRLEDTATQPKPVQKEKAAAAATTKNATKETSVMMGKPSQPRLDDPGLPKDEGRKPVQKPAKKTTKKATKATTPEE